VDESPVAAVVRTVAVVADHEIVVFGDSDSGNIGGFFVTVVELEECANAVIVKHGDDAILVAGLVRVVVFVISVFDQLEVILLIYKGLPLIIW